ncbi:MAG: SGNH/GDSL hydrolase family protein [Clostridia bacterium]|nr:SGNH/GDSL hydrolase family protein [Clostridia bacterium]
MSKVILFQGDSITDGNRLRDNEWDLNHQMGHGYAYIVNSKLGLEYPEKNLKFVNKGISGNKISDLSARWSEDTLRIKPDILSILIGINDCEQVSLGGNGSDAGMFEEIYRKLLDEAKADNPDIKFVLIEPFFLPVGERKAKAEEYFSILKGYQEATKQVAEDYGAIFLPLQSVFNELSEKYSPDYWCWDGVHPTVCGHGIIAEEWMRYCKELI